MLVGEVMQKDVLKMKPTESIQDAAKKMRESHSSMAVIVEEEEFKGILTEQDIISNSDISASTLAGDEGNRCCYFNSVQLELLIRA